jgi:hypothetical protein
MPSLVALQNPAVRVDFSRTDTRRNYESLNADCIAALLCVQYFRDESDDSINHLIGSMSHSARATKTHLRSQQDRFNRQRLDRVARRQLGSVLERSERSARSSPNSDDLQDAEQCVNQRQPAQDG